VGQKYCRQHLHLQNENKGAKTILGKIGTNEYFQFFAGVSSFIGLLLIFYNPFNSPDFGKKATTMLDSTGVVIDTIMDHILDYERTGLSFSVDSLDKVIGKVTINFGSNFGSRLDSWAEKNIYSPNRLARAYSLFIRHSAKSAGIVFGDLARQSYEKNKKIEAQWLKGKMWEYGANCFTMGEEYDSALVYFKNALESYSEIDSTMKVFDMNIRLSDTYSQLVRIKSADQKLTLIERSLKHSNAAYEIAKSLKDSTLIPQAIVSMAKIEANKARFGPPDKMDTGLIKAIDLMVLAKKIAEKHCDSFFVARLNNNLANCYSELGIPKVGMFSKNFLDSAIFFFNEALKYYLDPNIGRAKILGNRAIASNELGLREKDRDLRLNYMSSALSDYRTSLSIYEKFGQPLEVARIKHNLSDAIANYALTLYDPTSVGYFEEAENLIKQALEKRKRSEFKDLWAASMHNYGEILFFKALTVSGRLRMNNLLLAKKMLKQAVDARSDNQTSLSWLNSSTYLFLCEWYLNKENVHATDLIRIRQGIQENILKLEKMRTPSLYCISIYLHIQINTYFINKGELDISKLEKENVELQLKLKNIGVTELDPIGILYIFSF